MPIKFKINRLGIENRLDEFAFGGHKVGTNHESTWSIVAKLSNLNYGCATKENVFAVLLVIVNVSTVSNGCLRNWIALTGEHTFVDNYFTGQEHRITEKLRAREIEAFRMRA